MKKLSFYFLISTLLTSCAAGYQEIGSLNMLSDRHIDANGHYQKLVANAGTSKKEMKSSTATNIEQAINQVVDQVPGGQYLTNVKIYAVNGDYLAVTGDVWGKAQVKENGSSSTINEKTALKAHSKRGNHNNDDEVAQNVTTFSYGSTPCITSDSSNSNDSERAINSSRQGP